MSTMTPGRERITKSYNNVFALLVWKHKKNGFIWNLQHGFILRQKERGEVGGERFTLEVIRQGF